MEPPESTRKEGKDLGAPSVCPLVSIVIPTHNRKTLLEEMLRTVPDVLEVEVIVVNDRSTQDWRPDVSFDRVSLLCVDAPPDHRHAGEARNHGVSLARGEWIVFVDNDDALNTSVFLSFLDVLRASRADIVFGKVEKMSAGDPDRVSGLNGHVEAVLSGANASRLVRHFPVWGKAYRRSFLREQGLWFTDLRLSEDSLFSVQAFVVACCVDVWDGVFLRIRTGHESLTRSVSTEGVVSCVETIVSRINPVLVSAGLSSHRVSSLSQARHVLRTDPFLCARLLFWGRIKGTPMLGTFTWFWDRFLSRRAVDGASTGRLKSVPGPCVGRKIVVTG